MELGQCGLCDAWQAFSLNSFHLRSCPQSTTTVYKRQLAGFLQSIADVDSATTTNFTMLASLLFTLAAAAVASAEGQGLQWTTYEDGDWALISTWAAGGRYPYSPFKNGRSVDL